MIKGMVSVIIPTTKRELHLAEECADSIWKGSYKNFEIIIVNEGFERSRQRNMGIKRANGEFLLFLDSDQFASKDLLEDCVNRIKGYSAVYIPEKIVIRDWFSRLRDWERQFYTATAIDVPRFVFSYGCPRFDETLNGPEDTDWDRRIYGQRTTSKSFVLHDECVSLGRYFRKKAYYAKSMGKFVRLNPHDKILEWKWRCIGVFLENGKWKKFLSSPHKAVAILFVIFLRGVIFLCAKKS